MGLSQLGGNTPTVTQSESSAWVTVSSSSSADTDGSYVELITSISFETKLIEITIRADDPQADIRALFDISVGAATSEVDKIIDRGYTVEQRTDAGHFDGINYSIPFKFDTGSRLAVRIQDGIASAKTYIAQITIYN